MSDPFDYGPPPMTAEEASAATELFAETERDTAAAKARGGNGSTRDHADGRREIEVSRRFMREIAADATRVLAEARTNGGVPLLYRRGTALVRLHGGVASAEIMTVDALRSMVDRLADFMSVRVSPDGGESRNPARPPLDVCRDILATPSEEIPALNGLADSPIYLPDGRLLSATGYDGSSGVLMTLDGLGEICTDMPIDEARSLLLDELLHDFPFVDDAGRAHTVAAMVQHFVRRMIAGPTPLYLFDAPARGTGKGLAIDTVAIVTTGRPAYVMSLPRDHDELEKRITASLMSAAPVILLDNVTRLDAQPLAAALTAVLWRGRLLGKSRMVDAPNDALWLASGNNVSLSDEMVRRTLPIRLDAGVERPEDRTGPEPGNEWRHADLLAWTKQHRTELVSACLSIIEAWRREGMPAGKETLGRYEAWCRVIGGILGVAGVSGVLSGRERLHEQGDRRSQEWVGLCGAWWEAHGEHPVNATDIFLVAKTHGLLLELWAGRSELAAVQRMGRALNTHRDRVFGGHIIRLGGRDSITGNNAYRLESRSESGTNTRNTGNTPPTPPIGGVTGVSGVSSGGSIPHRTPATGDLWLDREPGEEG